MRTPKDLAARVDAVERAIQSRIGMMLTEALTAAETIEFWDAIFRRADVISPGIAQEWLGRREAPTPLRCLADMDILGEYGSVIVGEIIRRQEVKTVEQK